MKGKESELSVEQELELNTLSNIGSIWKCEYTYFGGDVFSRIDGVFTRYNVIKGVFDVKVRKQSLSWYQDYKSVMLNFNKIQVASELSRILKVKFFHIVETSDKHIMVFDITKDDGTIVCPMNIRYSNSKVSKATKKVEFNKQTAIAYLPLENNEHLTIYRHKGNGY
jgi:hypothetical protein